MTKKKATATIPGNQYLKARGLVALPVHLTPAERDMIRRAAAFCDPPQSMTRFAAAAVLEAARKVLKNKSFYQ